MLVLNKNCFTKIINKQNKCMNSITKNECRSDSAYPTVYQRQGSLRLTRYYLFSRSFYKQIGRVMKMTFILVTVVLLHAYADGYSQRVTLSGKQVPIESFFSVIKAQTGYVFFYDSDLLKTAKPVTLSIVDLNLSDALVLLFKNQPFVYGSEERRVGN